MTGSGRRQIMRSGLKTDAASSTAKLPPPGSGSHAPVKVGDRFGSWEVTTQPVLEGKYRMLTARCALCSTLKKVALDNLKSGKSKGCRKCYLQRGGLPTWLYARMNAAHQRCANPKNVAWVQYGGRGIEFRFTSVWEATKWAWETLKPRKEQVLDRVDNNGHYEPGNLRFVDVRTSNMNRSNTKLPADWTFKQEEWPYSEKHVRKLLYAGMSREQVLAHAKHSPLRHVREWSASTIS